MVKYRPTAKPGARCPAMEKYSLFSLIRHARHHHEKWQRAWRDPTPKKAYDTVIVGGGGHGLATAYYLAKVHGVTDVAVVEKGWLGGGNTGRNTTIVRSNYLRDEAARLYDFALKLWPGLSEELNFNVMFSPRGVLNLGHSLQDMRDIERRVNANRLNGIDGEVLSTAEVDELVPLLNCSPDLRYPVLGASWQPRGGVARHDAVAWGYARAADSHGVDLLQNTEVTGIRRDKGAVSGVETSRGFIGARKVACVTAGNSGVLAAMAGLRLPIESHPLQALVSEPLKPCLDTVVMSNAVHCYISQADKGDLVIGAGIDQLQRLRAARIVADCRTHPAGGLRTVPFVQPRAHEPPMGRHRRRLSRCLSDHRNNVRGGSLLQLRLGHRRLQGDAGIGLRIRGHAGQGASASPRRTVCPGSLRDRRAGRRARRRRGRPLMLRIPCPYCGEARSQEEFSYAGEAHIRRPPNPDAVSDREWGDYLHLRNNPRGPHREMWVHAAGCRRYFNVLRDTVSYEILTVYPIGHEPEDPSPEGAP